ncbi:hypothetical protein [Pseudodesulfovibrio sp.]|uniref:hypothetical protein n=1 Tax=unclassified Pseudodesulfovibrio TaxID=2661612 RepID=UPI003AFFE2A6
MELDFTIHGHSCDLALHPISAKTAKLITKHGSDIYAMKPMDWWRNGKTNTWGMRIDDECAITLTLDGAPVDFNRNAITESPVKIRRRMYLESRAKYIAVFGFDNEICKFTWKWDDVTSFDPSKFEFMVHQWDRIMGCKNYFILDEVKYNGTFANDHHWCEAQGFTLVEPKVIDLAQVRKELQEKGEIPHTGSYFPAPKVEVDI